MPPDEVESPVSAVMNEKWSLIFSEATLPKIKRTKKMCIVHRVTAPGRRCRSSLRITATKKKKKNPNPLNLIDFFPAVCAEAGRENVNNINYLFIIGRNCTR